MSAIISSVVSGISSYFTGTSEQEISEITFKESLFKEIDKIDELSVSKRSKLIEETIAKLNEKLSEIGPPSLSSSPEPISVPNVQYTSEPYERKNND